MTQPSPCPICRVSLVLSFGDEADSAVAVCPQCRTVHPVEWDQEERIAIEEADK